MGIRIQFRRLFHWGPLTALGIIKIITFMTIHCSRQWWPPHQSALATANFVLFLTLSLSTLYHFMNAIFEGPGYLPLKWEPEKISDCQFLQYCSTCQGYKAPRSHHCRKCSRCVLKMDHHCPWINNCVGHYNHGYFVGFLASAVAGCSLATINLTSWLMCVLSRQLPYFPMPSLFTLVLAVFAIGLSIGVILAVGMLLYFQTMAVIKNRTEIEEWILRKAQCRERPANEKFVHPYSHGVLFNIKQVLSWHCTPPGDGITWPVIEGCDQYTLTREQLAQKLEKRKRTHLYRIISKVTGSWFPISYGFRVFCSPPFTDEPRIKLEVGNIVSVTRFRKWWLFGQKENNGAGDDRSRRVRGWFPRPAAIEVIENDDGFVDKDNLTSFSKDR